MNNIFTVQTGNFEGPLDLLLSLIQDRKLYINELSLAEVTGDYLKYISNFKDMPIGETAQFVLVAATLLLIKSRSLLPNLELTEEEEQSIEELERRLAQYRIIKKASGSLRQIWGMNTLVISKARKIYVHSFSPREATIKTLHKVGRNLADILPVSAFKDVARIAPIISLDEMIEDLQKRILQRAKASFKSLTGDAPKEEVVVQFLALLELLRGGDVRASQLGTFGDIMVESDSVNTPKYGD